MTRSVAVLLVVLMAALIAVAQTTPPTQKVDVPGGEARLTDFKGDVSAIAADGSVLTVARGLVLKNNFTLNTGKGSALLQMQDGSQVLVKAKSQVVIKDPAQGDGHWFELLIGKIRATVQKHLGEEPPFRLGTPTAVITVRGTDFLVSVDKKKKTSVYVFAGVVEFAALGALNKPVLIKPGFYSEDEPDRLPQSPQPMSPDSGDRTQREQEDSTGSRNPADRTQRNPAPSPQPNSEREKPD